MADNVPGGMLATFGNYWASPQVNPVLSFTNASTPVDPYNPEWGAQFLPQTVRLLGTRYRALFLAHAQLCRPQGDAGAVADALAESGARVDVVTAAVHALLFYVAISTFLLWCVDIAFGLMRADRRLGHDLLLGLAVVHAR